MLSDAFRAWRAAWATALRIAADMIHAEPPPGIVDGPATVTPPPPDVMPSVGDMAESWVQGLVWHHGPNETCLYWDCYPCWVRPHEGEDAE